MASITVGYYADGTPCDYTTIATAYAAASIFDRLLIYYSTADKGMCWKEKFGDVTSKPVSAECMVKGVFFFCTGSHFWVLSSSSLGTIITEQVTLRHLRVVSPVGAYQGFSINASYVAMPNNLILWDSCEVEGFQYGFLTIRRASVTVQNCIARNSQVTGFHLVECSPSAPTVCSNNTAISCGSIGINLSGYTYVYNNIAMHNTLDFDVGYNQQVHGYNNVSSDTSADDPNWTSTSGHIANAGGNYFAFFAGEAEGNLHDYRCPMNSFLIGKGYSNGLDHDIDGNTRADPPSIGASEGVNRVYNPDFPEAENTLTTDTTNGVTGRWVKADAASYELGETFGVDGTSETGTYVATCTAPNEPTLTAGSFSDSQSTLLFTLDGTDDIYALYRVMNGTSDWSEENGTFSRTGSGTVDITGLTNDVAYQFIGYAKNASGLYSTPSNIISGIPSSGTSDIDKIMIALVAEINTAQIKDSNGTAIVAEKEIPPRFDAVGTPKIKVYPDNTSTSPIMSGINRNRYRLGVCLCWHTDDADKTDGMLYARDQLVNLLAGKRLTAYSDAFCVGEVDASALDYEALSNQDNFLSPITFEYQISKRRE